MITKIIRNISPIYNLTLSTVSEGVYKEYDQLKNQHEMEVNTMRKAMDRASRWYKENKELKRKSSVLIQRVKQEVSTDFKRQAY